KGVYSYQFCLNRICFHLFCTCSFFLSFTAIVFYSFSSIGKLSHYKSSESVQTIHLFFFIGKIKRNLTILALFAPFKAFSFGTCQSPDKINILVKPDTKKEESTMVKPRTDSHLLKDIS